jgi:uncharacterized damage-inducible protein DinB
MSRTNLINDYLAGPQKLREAIAAMPPDEIDARPVPDKWSTRQVVCHITDCEVVYADRMKRVIAEENPLLLNLHPNAFAAALAYQQRDIEEELRLIEATRGHIGQILRAVEPACFQRTGIHSTDGPITLEKLLQRITGHIPHHIKFIEEKRAAMKSSGL